MKVIDMDGRYEGTFLMCLEDWSDEMKEAGNHKCEWLEKMKDRGLGVKLAVDDEERAIGMIQYVPIEYSTAEGKDLYFIDCIWVHGYKEGIGDHQKQGVGSQLLKAAEVDVMERGAKGLVAWGLGVPMWMRASWFKKNGYKKVDKNGIAVLMWKPFTQEAKKPSWVKAVKHPEKNQNPGKVTVTAFINGRCNVTSIDVTKTRRAIEAIGGPIVYNEINTFDRQVFLEWGISDCIYVEDQCVTDGPPLSYDKIYKLLEKKVKKL